MVEPKLPEGWINTSLGKVVEYGKTDKCELSDVSSDTWVLELEDIEKDSSKILQQLDAAKHLRVQRIDLTRVMFYTVSSGHI